MSKKITLVNIISTLILQFVTIASYFIIPKIILSNFGSDVNGLISSINQLLNYITLVEGGITGVVTANLYKPLISRDNCKISTILNTADLFYKKIGFIYIIYCLLLAIIYPIIFNTGFSWDFVFILTLILAINLFIQYMFSLTYKTLLNADKKNYVISFLQTIIIILGIILAYVSVVIYPNIHLLKFLTGIVYIAQPLVYKIYIKKHYNIQQKTVIDKELLKQRWNGFSINLAAFIHMSTDITLLTIFTDLSTVSIYTVYALVTNGLRQIITAISSSISHTIGQSYARGNIEEINQKIDIYEYIISFIVFFSFSVAALLITPFVMTYTKGIEDANYYQPIFGTLLLLSEGLYLIKEPHVKLAYSANKFKEITKPAFFEAIINIVISLILIKKYGLIGIMIGTIIAMLYRLIFHVHYTSKILINRKQKNFYKKILIFTLGTIIGILFCINVIPKTNYNLISLILNGIYYCCIFLIIYGTISVIMFKNEVLFIKNYILRKRKNLN